MSTKENEITLAGLAIMLADFAAKIDRRFDAVDQRFEVIDHRFDLIDQRFGVVERRLDAMDGRFNVMDKRFDAMDGQFDKLIGTVNVEFIKIRAETATLATREDVKELSERLKRLEEQNIGTHALDLHRRTRRLEKQVFKAA